MGRDGERWGEVRLRAAEERGSPSSSREEFSRKGAGSPVHQLPAVRPQSPSVERRNAERLANASATAARGAGAPPKGEARLKVRHA